MIKHLLTATAIAVLAGVAHAAETNTTQTIAPDGTQTMSGQDLVLIANPSMRSNLASELIGETVYTNATAEGEVVGEINDLVIAENGEIEGVVISVGGFLGVGERTVAVDYNHLNWTRVLDAVTPEARLVLPVTAEQLENAPEFDLAMFQTDPNERLFGTATTLDDSSMVSGDQMATFPDTDLTKVDVSTISADDLMGTTVYSVDDESVGSVADVLISDDGEIDAVVLDIGGFLGLGTKPVAIAFEELMVRRDKNNALYVYTGFSRAQLEGAPDYDESRYLEDRDMMRLRTAT